MAWHSPQGGFYESIFCGMYILPVDRCLEEMPGGEVALIHSASRQFQTTVPKCQTFSLFSLSLSFCLSIYLSIRVVS